jgi:hypothetical protein
MQNETTNPVDGEAMPEVVDALVGDDDGLNPVEGTQDDDGTDEEGLEEETEGEQPEEDLEEVEWEGKQHRLPKGIKEALLRQADYTQKTQAVAEQAKALQAKEATVTAAVERQTAFLGDVAKLGALNAALEPYEAVKDWPTYLRQGGAEAMAHHAEYQALLQQRDGFARQLGEKVQQRQLEEQREAAKHIEIGRAELGKHIKGYGPDTLDKLVAFAAPFGITPDEVRQGEADPRGLRILHLAMVGQEALRQQKRTSTLAQGSKTAPVKPLRGQGGQIIARPDSDNFEAFERLVESRARPPKR